ncbi:hypothetical protein NS228_17670 [Methylobacterium indicum]|uniref:Uncharacterized protein n=2 Tax=Methylobacterium indicum TaxID=1775910 RepID=A0ABR5HI28_9HYPH|nr:hypothetical protein QR78_21480 [Methylobacterium indicum]KMO26271.1 hypothetical protein QR79_03285 [Methylobacterium indicum]KTS25014.1 hypothetical protein NS229_20765 [Methylobacterium indicum]KTS38311.1 hypothetical protein NS228_17670 [Methylobacterium indicum]KTS44828.1 hypothetical protein NS230_24780 [Methylobacterium indicum]
MAGCSRPCVSPERFLGLVAGATGLGLFPFVPSRIGATEVGGFEFSVSMRRDAEEAPRALRRR